MNAQARSLERLARRHAGASRPIERRTLTVCVASGKGGVGKSTIAINLAMAAARAGRDTLLVDGDVAMGSCDVLLGIAPERRIDAVIDGSLSPSDALVRVEPRLALLAGTQGMAALAEPSSGATAALGETIRSLHALHDLVVVDLASGISRQVSDLAGSADVLLLVLTPEPASVSAAYALVKILAPIRTGPTYLVLNRVTAAADPVGLVRRFHRMTERFLKQRPPVLGVVAEDSRVSEAAARMTPLLDLAPRTRAAVSIRRMARKLLSFGTNDEHDKGFVTRSR